MPIRKYDGALSDADLAAEYATGPALPMSDAELAAMYAPKKPTPSSALPASVNQNALNDKQSSTFDNLLSLVRLKQGTPAWQTPSTAAPPAAPVLPEKTQPESSWLDTAASLVRGTMTPSSPQVDALTQIASLVPGLSAITGPVNLLASAPMAKSAGGVLQRAAETTPTDVATAGPAVLVPEIPELATRGLKAIGAPEWLTAPIAPKSAKTGADIVKAADDHLRANAPNVDPNSAKQFAYDVASGAIQIAPLMAASLATKNPAPLLTGIAAQAYGDTYGTSRAAGRSAFDARKDAIWSAAANSLPAMIPFHALMQPGQKFLGKVLSSAGGAAAQNVLTTILQTAYDAGILKKEMTWGQAVRAVTHAGLVGAATGLAIGTGAHVADRATQPPPPATPAPATATPPPAAAAPPPAAEPPGPVHDPLTWAQTGTRQSTGEITPVPAPGAGAEGMPPPGSTPQAPPAAGATAQPLTPDAAKQALATNIDPATGLRPKGNAALREFRARMQEVAAGPEEEFDPTPYLQAVRAQIADRAAPLTPNALGRALNLPPDHAARVLSKLAAMPDSGLAIGPQGQVRRRPIFQGPSEAIRLLSTNGGLSDNEGHSLADSMGLQRFVPGAGPLIRPNGLSVDKAGELLWQHGFFGPPDKTPRPDTNQVLDLLGRSTNGKVHTPEDEAAIAGQREAQRASDDEATARAEIADHGKALNETFTAPETDEILGLMSEHGYGADDAVTEYVERLAMRHADDLAKETGDVRYAQIPPADRPAEDGGAARAGIAGPEGVRTDENGRGARGTAPAEGARAFAEEPGAEGLPQTIIPGTEPSARQAAASRETAGRGRKTTTTPQADAGALFEKPAPPAPDLFETPGLESRAGAKTSPPAEKTVAPPDGATVDENVPEPKNSPPDAALAARIKAHLDAGGTPLKQNALMAMASEAYGGTAGEGAYDPRRAYDAMETGANEHFASKPKIYDPAVDADTAKETIGKIRSVENTLPIQSRRTSDTDAFQQFSTPPAYGYAAAWAADIHPGDVVVEPSAGNGGLAVFAKNAGAHVVANELSPGRRANIERLGFDRVTGHDAEQLHNLLPDEIKPNVALMNPPFSAAAARGGVKDSNITGRHIDQALERLAPGGRLVAITGENFVAGNSRNSPYFKRWNAQHRIRASVRVAGDVFHRYGTNFATRVIVIDKAAPDGRPTVTGDVKSPEELIDRLKAVRDDRPQSTGSIGAAQDDGGTRVAEPPAAEPAGKGAPGAAPAAAGPVGAVRPPAGGGGAERPAGAVEGRVEGAAERPARGAARRKAAGGDDVVPAAGNGSAAGDGSATGGAPSGEPARQPDGRDDAGLPAGVEPGDGLSYRAKTGAESGQAGQDLGSDGVYQSYRPQRLDIPGAQPHPADLVQSAAMGSVQPPEPTYRPKLPRDVITKGLLSEAQLEPVVYAGQAHEKMLADGETRRGYFVGDGTGVGKGREISGIILDNMRQGRGKHVWLSEKWPLFDDAVRDWTGIGGDAAKLINGKKVKAGDAIGAKNGIYFTTYDTLKGKPKPGKPGISRVDQLVNWLGQDFDGVVALDEAHNMANADTRAGGRGKVLPSEKALAGVELQKKLPKARIVYVSATGATEVSNLAYAERLGLWGPGTAFPTKDAFISQIESGGVAAMELVARDLKQMGSYISRGLSFEGVQYDRLEHKLTDDQRAMYDNLASAWQGVLKNIDKALEITGGNKDGRSKAAAYSAFWGGHQRFFNQVLTSMEMPTVLDRVQKDLDEGGAPVLQLVNTNEAAQERALANLGDDEGALEELDLTPRDQLMQMVQHSFPVAAMETYLDENGTERARPVLDSEGNFVQDKQAVALREKVLDDLSSIRVPDGPLEYLLNRFGPDQVAEVTGRTRRVVERDGKRVIERRPGSANTAEADAFQSGKKKILVFSQAGGTGRSYHADRTAKNQAQRQHYLLQPGWSAAPAIQGFGRTHRSNQANKPFYRLATTDVVGQKRFISSIARRLDQLGALTKGQRNTGGQGLFSERDNLESGYAADAVTRLVTKIAQRDPDMEKAGLTPDVLVNQMGLRGVIDERTGGVNTSKIPNVTQFLNRLLSLTLDMQNKVFGAFDEMFGDNIDAARAAGTLDAGVEQLRADHIKVVHDQVVHTDPESGAETRYVALETKNRTKPRQWSDVEPGARLGGSGREVAFVARGGNGRAYAFVPTRDKTDDRGRIERQYRRVGPMSDTLTPAYVAEGSRYEQLEGDDARKAWDEELARVPEFQTKTEHMVTGALLPIWDRLPKGQARVYRAKTDDGAQLLGRVIPTAALRETLKNLGANAQKFEIAPPALFKRVLEAGDTATLANGWTLSRRTVAGEPRVKLTGPDPFAMRAALERQGVQFERIAYQGTFFIPNNERGTKFLETQLRQSPIVSMSGDEEPAFARRETPEEPAAPTFYSALTRGVEGLKLERAPAEQWRSTIKNLPGIKQDEIAWSGLDDFLASKPGPIAKADVLEHLRENNVQVKEVEKGRAGFTDEDVREYHDMSPDAWDQLRPAERSAMRVEAEEAEGGGRTPPDLTKFGQYKLPGGENYRELLLTLPHARGEIAAGNRAADYAKMLREKYGERYAMQATVEERRTYDELHHQADRAGKEGEFRSQHFAEPNVLAHVRFDDRTGPNGEKILHMAEVQSDWHQKGRREGYVMPEPERQRLSKEVDDAYDVVRRIRDKEIRKSSGGKYSTKREALDDGDKEAFGRISKIEDAPEVKAAVDHWQALRTKLRENAVAVPDAPFKSTWHELAMKRMLRYAAEHDYDKLSWDPGETQADRFDLSKRLSSVNAELLSDGPKAGQYEIVARDNDHKQVLHQVMPAAKLSDVIGKELADKIVSEAPQYPDGKLYSGLDLKVGGEGQRGFYDKILPTYLNKYAKRWGAKVGETRLSEKDNSIANDSAAHAATLGVTPVHSIDITPAMRESVMQGQPLFQKRAPAGWEGEPTEITDPGTNRPPRDRVALKSMPEKDSARQAAMGELRARLDKLGLNDVALELPDSIKTGAMEDDPFPGSANGMYWKKVIHVALDSAKPREEILDHEAVHAVRKLGLIDDSEWSVLERKAGAWADKYKVDRIYGDIGPERRTEEAIAHAFPDWRAGRLGNAGNAIGRIFRKIANFFEAVGNIFRGHGFKSTDDVFGAIASGEVGRRRGQTEEPPSPVFARRRPEEDEPPPEDDRPPPSFVTRMLGERTQDLGKRISKAAARLLPESVKEAADAIQMAVTPMAAGSNAARASAKDFANAMRKARVIGGRQVEYLAKTFTPDELKKMWEAADEQSVLMQTGASTAGRGLETLTPAQRRAVETFQADSNEALRRAQEVGLFKSEGLPSYVPRMVVALGSDGKYERLGAAGDAPHGLDAIGRNLKTTSPHLRFRKYLTTTETETAAGNINPDAVVVRDFRTLPLASQRLNEAVAGRELINKIRSIGHDTGELTVADGHDPSTSQQKWFTLDHPSFKTYGPLKDSNGEIVMHGEGDDAKPVIVAKPLYVRGDFEGPLRAVLSRDTSKIYDAAMAIKGKTMSVIMYSPLMHNAVIWGKALPAAPLKLLKPWYTGADGKLRPGIALYGEGRAAKNDPATMKEALDNGLDPIGHRYFNQDISAVMEEPNIKPGRSWTAQAIGSIPGLFDKAAGDRVKAAIDRAGDVWHNKLLWDLVGDLQMGLYTHMRDKAIKSGVDKQSAGRLAAHFANRYGGALPMESMSKIARQTANMLLFSRSFTLTNLGAFKDLVVGLPKDVQAQILRDKGVDALNRVQGAARRKAISLLAMDIFLSHAGLFLAQYALAWFNGQQPHPPSQNEPDKESRFLMGYQDDGTAVYGRLPTGKVGEELQDWVTEPAAVLTRKLSPFGKLLYGAIANDQGFGQKIYDPYDKSVSGYFKNIGRIAQFAAESVAPLSPFDAVGDILRGRGETKTNIEKLLLPMIGVTVSKGAPGGPAVGLMYSSKDQHAFKVQEAMPDIRNKIRDGDIDGAQSDMIDLGMPKWRRSFTIQSTLHPGSRLSRRQLDEFRSQASPEEKADMERFIQEEQSRAAGDQHSALEPHDLPTAITDPAKLRRAADAGMIWSRQEAIDAAAGAGQPATAELLRNARDPVRPELRRLAFEAG